MNSHAPVREIPTSSPLPQAWEEEELFFDGDAYFDSILEAIKHAQKSIDFESYIFENDSLGKRVVDALKAAARRGVVVRLIVDGIGSPSFIRAFLDPLLDSGVQVRIFHPLPWQITKGKIETFTSLFERLNKRNHRKVCIVDGKEAWIGSLNVSQSHLQSAVGHRAWRDTGVKLKGEALDELRSSFESLWSVQNIPRLPIRTERRIARYSLIRLNNTWVRRRILYKDLIKRIRTAKKKIWITNAYFVPDGSFLRALHAAARRGVDIRILVPRESDVFFFKYVVAAFYFGLLKSGVKVYEYLPSFLHAKSMIIDDWVVVGTSNLNHRSLLHDFEVDVVLKMPKSLEALEEQFLKDLDFSANIDLEAWRARPWFDKLLGSLILFFRYWL